MPAVPGIKTDRKTIRKTPNETRRLTFKFAGVNGQDMAPSEVLTGTPVVTILPSTAPALTFGAYGISGQNLDAEFAAGAGGNVYEITAKMTTSLGQTLEQRGYLRVDPA